MDLIYDNKKLDINSFNLYLNSVGGHSLFIEISPNLLIKSSNDSEIDFYKYINKSNIKSSFSPEFIGVISKNSYNFNLIKNYIEQCLIFFKIYINKFNIKAENINIENDEKFGKIFSDFISNNNNNKNIKLNRSFDYLERTLNKLFKENINKFKWILFWFIKWNKQFLLKNFLVLKNLTYKMIKPTILDIKLGASPKISKDNGEIKIFGGAFNDIGCRIMGIQKEKYFKNKYDTKNYNLIYFKQEIKEFFHNKTTLINISLNKINKLIKEINENIKFKLIFSSLLILFDDTINNNDKIIINLIDFSFFEKIESNNDLISSINNFVRILNEIKEDYNK
jgi:hypothetical protein